MKLVFAIKRTKNTEGNKVELDYLKKYLSENEYNFLITNSVEKKRESYSSYMAMAQSRVTVGKCSTLLRENLSIGGKILACNLTPTNIYDFPIEGICSIKNCDFQEFEKRLLKIYTMSEEDYF